VTAEDIVQEMYIKILLKLKDGLDIIYVDEEVNYYYIFKTLRTLFIDLKRKEKNLTYQEINNCMLLSQDANFKSVYEDVQNTLNELYWYDKKIFDIINSGETIASLSRKTGIKYYSLYNTYKKVKEKLKQLL
jgi:DNA-directed RNA polymerase specialized sigma24 family protein